MIEYRNEWSRWSSVLIPIRDRVQKNSSQIIWFSIFIVLNVIFTFNGNNNFITQPTN